MNAIETIGAVAAAIVGLAIVAVVVQPNSTAPRLVSSIGTAFSTSVRAAVSPGK